MANPLPSRDALHHEWIIRELENVRVLKRTVQRMREETDRWAEQLRESSAEVEPRRRAG